GDQVVQHHKKQIIRPIGADDKRRCGASDILLGNIDSYLAGIRSRMTRSDHQLRGICRIRSTKRMRLSRDTGIDLAVLRLHGKVVYGSLRYVSLYRSLRRRIMGGADNKVPVRAGRRTRAIRQFLSRYITRRMRVADRRLGYGRICAQYLQPIDGLVDTHPIDIRPFVLYIPFRVDQEMTIRRYLRREFRVHGIDSWPQIDRFRPPM